MSLLDQYRALHEGAGLIDRSHRGRLLLTGADRRAYLQGLLTNDIVALAPGSGCYAAYLTAQGRMIADMRVFETGDALLVDLAGDLADGVRTRWSQFIFSEDVQVQDLSASTAQLGIYGPRAAEVLAQAFASDAPRRSSETMHAAEPGEQPPDAGLPRRSSETRHAAEPGVLESMPMYGNARWMLRGASVFVPLELKDEVTTRLRHAGGAEVGPEAAEVCRIEAGRPLFHADMDTETIPLEAGIEDRAISLTKGCYVGQEIIIRVLHRGHGRVARRLVGVTLDPSAAVPVKGERLRAGDREVGTITSAAASPALGRPIALASVHRDFVEPGTVLSTTGATATVTALPFVRGSSVN
jgi:folate-binding protein YgfZ